jgi:hypothetical protein
LVTEKPEFKPPSQTPPFLSNLNPSPNDILLIPRKPGTSESMKVYVEKRLAFTVYSEDLQEVLWGVAYAGPPATPTYINSCRFPPSVGTIDKGRPLDCPIDVSNILTPGCHPITTLFSHDPGIYSNPQTERPVGLATWWAQVGFDDSETDPEKKYAACVPNPRTGDAGADAPEAGGL